MIRAREMGGARFAARLAAQAAKIARARAEARLHGERRWRLARLLWPLFVKER
ncbi:MAG TPA: hypothetical protein VI168_10270 [Croceibacterium sp.]